MKISKFADDGIQLMHDEIPRWSILLLVLTAILLFSEVCTTSTVLILLVLTVKLLSSFSIIGRVFNSR